MQIQISNMNVMVSCHSEDLPFNQSQESLRRMAFNELGTRRVLNLIFLRVRYSWYTQGAPRVVHLDYSLVVV